MIYVFEGIPGSGKTTTSTRFAKRVGLKVYDDPSRHAPSAKDRTPEDWMKLGNQANLDVVSFSGIADFVVDRWCLTGMTLDYLRGVYAGDEFYVPIARSTSARIYLLDLDPEVAISRASRVRERGLSTKILAEQRIRYLESVELWRSWGGDVTVIDSSKVTDVGEVIRKSGSDLSDLLSRQRAFNVEFFEFCGLSLDDLSVEERETWTRRFVLHIEDELHEFLRETRWKMHRSSDIIPSKSNLLEEWIDVLKFLLGLANVWGFDSEELVAEFYRKSAIVEGRFRHR